jgi:hypothetical protein
MQKVQEAESRSNTPIVYCVADVVNVKNMSVHTAYQVKFGERGSPVDAVLPLLPGLPLMITQNIDRPLGTLSLTVLTLIIGLVNGKIVNFFGFADSEAKCQHGRVISPPAYMLVKVPKINIRLGHFPASVIPLKPSSFTFKIHKGSAKFRQFAVTLAYAITDYKCQGETYFNGLLCDLQTPPTGSTEPASLYVQLSRVQSLQHLSIMREFNPNELRKPVSDHLIKELAWEEQIDKDTREKYGYLV